MYSYSPSWSCQLCNQLAIPCNLVTSFVRDTQTYVRRGASGVGTPPSSVDIGTAVAPQSSPWTLITPSSPYQALLLSSQNGLRDKTRRGTTSSILPGGQVLREVVDIYFQLIHNFPHTLFYKPGFWAGVESGEIPEMILLGMLALSLRFSRNECFRPFDPRSRGKEFSDEARRHIHLQMMDPSVATVQVCVLIGHYLGGEGDVKSKHIYLGLARLHAQAIRLWEMPVDSTIVSREIRRRTWLSVIIAENWSATDMSTQPVLSSEHDMLFPIMDEVEFLTLEPAAFSDGLNFQSSQRCMWAQMAATIDIFRQISAMISKLSLNLRSLDSYRVEISDLSQRLDHWFQRLPPELQYSMENLVYFGNAGLGLTFLGMHMGYHHFRQLLYYPFLNSQANHDVAFPPHLLSGDRNYARLCKKHALAISDLIKLGFDTSGCNPAYFLTGHILVVSSSIHLHTLLFGEDQAAADVARERLVSNFEILMQLKMYWPVIDSSVARLREFQNSRRLSVSDSFVLDNWMLKFLMEHTANLGPDSHPIPQTQDPPLPFDLDAVPFDPVQICDHPVVGAGAGISELEPENLSGLATSSLSTLLQDKSMSNEAVVDNALHWLLDQDLKASEYWPQSYELEN
ncbi:hypothetical protein VF21_07254 [Pseudogymnoascus sp. 05NY08]|nr:hypothetical protein VF21_07254 [Pseudogymnoascus sp. 05NY08]